MIIVDSNYIFYITVFVFLKNICQAKLNNTINMNCIKFHMYRDDMLLLTTITSVVQEKHVRYACTSYLGLLLVLIGMIIVSDTIAQNCMSLMNLLQY